MDLKSQLKPFAGAIMVFAGAVFFSGKAVLVKIGYSYGASVMSLLNLRMLFALPFFIIMAYMSEKNTSERVSSKDWLSVIFLGVIGYYLASYFDFEGLRYISAGMERIILFTYPTMVVVLSAIFFNLKIQKKQLIALLITYIGIIIAFYGEGEVIGKKTMSGAMLIFASAFTYAMYLVGSGQLIPKIGARRFTAYGMIVSTFAVLIHSSFTNNIQLVTDPKILILGFCMAVFCTVIPSVLLAEGIKRIGSSPASIVASVGPVSTIILAAMFLGESITLIQVLGTVLVISGVLLVSKKEEKKLTKIVKI